jgi:UDP-GlcNAc:undecaprenyl-phosphate GlcNAc-1-phosphate transferase
MTGTLIHFALPLLVTILFTFALRPFAESVGLIDRPGGRKMHVGEVPVIGGLAMMAGLVVGCMSPQVSLPGFPYFVSSLLVLVFVGALDDRYDLPASVRFLAQACAALLMTTGGDVLVRDLGTVFFNGVWQLGWFSVPFTLLIVLSAINAINMFDGSDGIAGVQALIGLIFYLLACILSGAQEYMYFILVLMGCTFGFLLSNWPSRRTASMRSFMGDAGSTMLGFALAWLSVEVSQAPSRAITPVAILWVFALPIFDFFSSMVRRVIDGRSPFHGDSDHLHHILRRMGYSSRKVAQSVLIAAPIFGTVGVGGHILGVHDGVLFIAWLVAAVSYYVFFHSGLVIPPRVQTPAEEPSKADSYAG